MAVNFSGCTFENLGVGVLAPDGTEVNVESSTLSNMKHGVVLYQSQDDLLEKLFLNGVPVESVKAAADELKKSAKDDQVSILEKYELSKWIKVGSDISTIINNLTKLF
ncbi:hypothetical protein [Pantoea ananatis]|uniref:hypothetical protein n=1 Tax=Pantoea ananas TaxID=553 RepID=UPI00049696B2|nr:hypothetical protein [Pantoea ananatis]